MDLDLDLLRELSELDGVPAFEHEVRTALRRHLEPLASIEHDRLGSVIARKQGTSGKPTIMLAAHMDEIGFMVRSVTEKGFLRFQTLGGWWEPVILAQPVVVKGKKGDVPGVIGAKPPHILTEEERKKFPEKKDMFVDVGASSRDEVEKMGISPGDPIVPRAHYSEMRDGKLLMGKAWDDRVGCAVMVEVLRRLKHMEHPNTVYAVGTVQEEVGLRGARTSAHMVNPDASITLEVAVATDTPGVGEGDTVTRVSGGPVIFTFDGSMIPNPRLRDLVIAIAEEKGIPCQFEAMPGGGTDAGQIHVSYSGVPSLVVGVATRYIHSPNSVMSLEDYAQTVDLVTWVLTRMDQHTVDSLTS